VRTLAGLIPFLALFLLARTLYRRSGSWRTSLLSAAIVWGVAVTIMTEGLSLARWLSFGWLLAAWLTVVAVLALNRWPDRRVTCGAPAEVARVGRWWPALAGLAVIASAAGVIAVAAPPNTSDSLVYHMPRVAHWIQNGSVAHYPTHVSRQLHLTPWAEFAILQPQILSGGDRFANLVQWLAMLGCLVAVSLVVQQLGGDGRAQIVAAVVCGTIPMGILQASGTQNDYVVSFWLVCFVYYGRALARSEGGLGEVTAAALAGASLGLALLTKATAYIFALPFLTWTILDCVRQRGTRRWTTMAIVSLAVLLLNAGHSWRNVQIYGSPLGPGREGPFVYANEAFGPSALVSNSVRNIALHLGTPDARVNAGLERAVGWLHDQAGADINDAKTTWLGAIFHVAPPRAHEDFAGNPAHVVLMAVSLTMLLVVPTLRRRRDLLGYASALIAAFVLFAAYLKWQPWHSRLHLPLFVLWSPLIAMIWGPCRWVAGGLVAALLVMSAPSVVFNNSRPLLGADTVIARRRVDQYFMNRKDLREPYAAAMRRVHEAGCSQVGLWLEDEPEYPLWVLAGREGGVRGIRIEHINVINESARCPVGSPFQPCAILEIAAHPSIPATVSFHGFLYQLRLRVAPVSLFLRE
jgi:Dolichyl-phosphate-mannose-protein mannosyltransferase